MRPKYSRYLARANVSVKVYSRNPHFAFLSFLLQSIDFIFQLSDKFYTLILKKSKTNLWFTINIAYKQVQIFINVMLICFLLKVFLNLLRFHGVLSFFQIESGKTQYKKMTQLKKTRVSMLYSRYLVNDWFIFYVSCKIGIL